MGVAEEPVASDSCGVLEREVSLADLNTEILHPPPLTGKWVSQRSNTRFMDSLIQILSQRGHIATHLGPINMTPARYCPNLVCGELPRGEPTCPDLCRCDRQTASPSPLRT
ncbi:hypothetical protein J6590_004394 [Homalodisca vitripennis]|nr:hypothetical protein J6590_004394 [Homalodisca vitripennis]